MAAEHDEVIPSRSTRALYERFGAGVATFRTLPGTGHNTMSEHPDYWPLIGGAP
jgi:pimeloyl-ACP methyl ester carboxylesterase